MDPEPPPPQDDDQIVCPHCLHHNEPEAAFCTECGAPIGMVANVDPIQRIASGGFGFRSAADGPPRRIILIGIWLFFLPMAVISMLELLLRGIESNWLFSPVLLLISVGILYQVTRNYLVKSRAERNRQEH